MVRSGANVTYSCLSVLRRELLGEKTKDIASSNGHLDRKQAGYIALGATLGKAHISPP